MSLHPSVIITLIVVSGVLVTSIIYWLARPLLNIFKAYHDLSQHTQRMETEHRVISLQLLEAETARELAQRQALSFAEGARSLLRQVAEAHLEPAWTPSQAELQFLQKYIGGRPTTYREPKVEVWHLLGQYFNEEELRSLCFELGVDFDNIPGSIKEAKAQGLTELMWRTGELGNLVDLAKEKRPNLIWPSIGI